MLSVIELLNKYDVAGPRYTSYPTLPVWANQVTAADYQTSLSQIRRDDQLSLYVHIPFCENQCHFCACSRIATTDHSLSANYVHTVIKELELVAQNLQNTKAPVTQIHFGGGSPNFLHPAELSLIMRAINKHFDVLQSAELAIEINPKTTSPAFCAVLGREGFNRVSLGVQDFSAQVQQLIHRHQTSEDTQNTLSQLKTHGVTHFNFDLVYGLPGQSLRTFQTTLETVLSLDPDRLAIYSYAHLPWTQDKQRSFDERDLPSNKLKLKLFSEALQFLTAHNYHQIGLDHFAKTNDELYQALKNKTIHRNFMGYSTRAQAHQIGLGATSISFVNGNYFQNEKNVVDYQNLIAKQQLATTKGHLLSHDDTIRRDLINQIMCHQFVDITVFEKKHTIHFADYFKNELLRLKEFAADGLVTLDNNILAVTRQGQITLRNIAMCFDAFLHQRDVNTIKTKFSRTI
ncbi:MAG: hypothetical protein ACD_62C00064G0002 [uncultured bacterium]|nr:MAG: hypothetical protein ACD_62C00064G0002 [uncultured bacterium]